MGGGRCLGSVGGFSYSFFLSFNGCFGSFFLGALIGFEGFCYQTFVIWFKGF